MSDNTTIMFDYFFDDICNRLMNVGAELNKFDQKLPDLSKPVPLEFEVSVSMVDWLLLRVAYQDLLKVFFKSEHFKSKVGENDPSLAKVIQEWEWMEFEFPSKQDLVSATAETRAQILLN